jgi:hypothetical protein
MTITAIAPETINLADYAEIRTVGNVRIGDVLVRDFHLLVVTKVTRTAKTVEFRAENAEAVGFNRLWTSKHRSSTSVTKALGSFTQIYRKTI